jgi:hypothetical protein
MIYKNDLIKVNVFSFVLKKLDIRTILQKCNNLISFLKKL